MLIYRPFSRAIRESQHQKCLPNWIILELTMTEVVVTTGVIKSYKMCKAPVKSLPSAHQLNCLQAGCPSYCPTNTVRALKAKSITLPSPNLTFGSSILVLTMKGFWLPWGGLPSPSSALWCQQSSKWKKRSERCKYCALAVVRLSHKFSPRRRPPSRGHRTAKI